MFAIQVTKLAKYFNGLKAINNISFNVQKGEIFGLLGPNGAGKTTLLKMLSTLLRPTKGKALVWGHDIHSERDQVRNVIGIVFQDPALDNRLTGQENLDFHARLYRIPQKTRKKRIAEVLTLVNLKPKANILVRHYSGGMQRRLEIARGLMHFPKVLFLDEPTLGLDPQTRRQIWQYIQKLNKKEKITVILTTHYMEEADFLCQRVGIIDFGKIKTIDTPRNLKKLIGDDAISLQTNAQQRACAIFAKLPWVKRIKKCKGVILLGVQEGEKKIPLIIQAAQQAGIRIESINFREPTLEDVFLHFTGNTIREEAVNGITMERSMVRRRFASR